MGTVDEIVGNFKFLFDSAEIRIFCAGFHNSQPKSLSRAPARQDSRNGLGEGLSAGLTSEAALQDFQSDEVSSDCLIPDMNPAVVIGTFGQ